MSRVGGSQKGIQNLSQTRPAKSVLSEVLLVLLLSMGGGLKETTLPSLLKFLSLGSNIRIFSLVLNFLGGYFLLLSIPVTMSTHFPDHVLLMLV